MNLLSLVILMQIPTLEVGESFNASESSRRTLIVEPGQGIQLTIDQRGCDVQTTIACGEEIVGPWDSSRGNWGVERLVWPNRESSHAVLKIEVSQCQDGGSYQVHWLSSAPITDRHQAHFDSAKRLLEAELLHQRGDAQSLDGAAEGYRQVIEWATTHKLNEQRALAENNLGHIFVLRGQFDDAEGHYRTALDLYIEMGDDWGIGRGHNNLGDLATSHGNLDEAMTHFQKALSYRERAHDHPGVAATWNNIATVYARQGDYRGAMQVFQRSATLPAIEDRQRALFLANLGFVKQALGESREASEAYHQAAEIQRTLDEGRGLAITLNNLAVVYRDLGQIDRSLETFQEARARFVEVDDRRGVAHAVLNLGVLYGKLDQLAKAEEYQLEATKLLQQVGEKTARVDALINLARTRHRLGKPDDAQAHFNLAMDLAAAASYEPGFCRLHLQRARCFADDKHWSPAQVDYEKSLSLARELGLRGLELEAVFGLSQVLEERGSLQDSRVRAMEAVEILDDLRIDVERGNSRTEFVATHAAVFDQAIRMLDAWPIAERPLKRLELIERARAKTLRDVLAEGRHASLKGIPEEISTAELAARDQIRLVQGRLAKANGDQRAGLQQALRPLMEEHERLLWQMRQSSPQFDSTYASGEVDLPPDLLQSDTAVLAYHVSEPHSYLMVWRGGRVSEFQIPGRAALVTTVTPLRQLIGSPVPRQLPRLNQGLHQLWQGVLAPAAELLVGLENLVFVLDGPLLEIPPGCWVTDPGGEANRYLIDEFTVTVVPSIQSWSMIRHADVMVGDGVLAFAHPFDSLDDASRVVPLSRDAFGPLPFSEKEVKAVQEIYGPRATTFSGTTATESAMRRLAPEAELIHVASHAWVDSQRLGLSGILMAADQEEDGLLQVFEVMGLRLKADCAVLSACNTAQGQIFWGEGVVGFAHAFFYAGVRSLVVSWWPVQDQSTASFMTLFHTNYANGSTVAQAVCGAARQLRAQNATRHPYYWAPFTAMGDATRIQMSR